MEPKINCIEAIDTIVNCKFNYNSINNRKNYILGGKFDISAGFKFPKVIQYLL